MNKSKSRFLGRALLAIGLPLSSVLLALMFLGAGHTPLSAAAFWMLAPFYYYAYSALLAAAGLIISGVALLTYESRPRLVARSASVGLAGVALVYLAYLRAAFAFPDCNFKYEGMCLNNPTLDMLATAVGIILIAGGLFGVIWPVGKRRPSVVLTAAAGISLILAVVPSFIFNYFTLQYAFTAPLLVVIWLRTGRLVTVSHGERKRRRWIFFLVPALAVATILFIIYAPVVPLNVPYESSDGKNCATGQSPCPPGSFPVYASLSFVLSGAGEVYVPISQSFMGEGLYWSPYLPM